MSISRRALLKNAAGAALAAAGAGLSGVLDASAQVTGLTPGGGKVPFRLPPGALHDLDRKQYIHNMEIHAHLPGASVAGGEPLMAMWAKGRQRMLPAGGGWVDVSDAKNPVVVKTERRGAGGAVVYNTKLRKWIAMSSAAAPLTSATPEFPYGQCDKELRDRTINFKGLRGIRTWDVTDPTKPNLLQEFSTGEKGMGTHMNFYDGGKYAYLECAWDDQLRMENAQRAMSHGLMIVDMSDPAHVKEVSRWWVPGQRRGEEDEYKKYTFAGDESSWTSSHGALTVPKRVEDGGTVGYGGFGAFGMYVMDLTDITKPKPYGKVRYEYETIGGIPFHTCYPITADAAHPRLQNIVIGIPETIQADCREPYKIPYVVDVKDPRNPKIIGVFPRPAAPPGAPYSDFCFARGRFGSHNTQCWLAPGPRVRDSRGHLVQRRHPRLRSLNPLAPKSGVVRSARDGEIDKCELVARNVGRRLRGVGPQPDLARDSRRRVLPLDACAWQAGARTRKIAKWSVAHCNVGWTTRRPPAYFGEIAGKIA
jgi:hypothetical protein